MPLYEIITQSARKALQHQATNGSMPSGHNGPYHDPETPVRNTAHWLITFLKAYEITNKTKFYQAGERAVAYLQSPEVRPMNAAFWMRKNPEKDFCNGLIGQAWVIEALVEAAKTYEREDLLRLAEEIFLLHPYDQISGGWRTVNVDGSYGPLDSTFNHQLWFAAAGGLITQIVESKIEMEVQDFMDRLENHLALYPTGLIRHKSISFLAPSLARKAFNLVRSLNIDKSPAYMKMKSVGYHGFNLYGFALLKLAFPEHRFWSCKKIKRALAYAKSKKFKAALLTSKYGFPYNPPGFEMPFAFKVFNDRNQQDQASWVNEQLRHSLDKESFLLTRNTEDPHTMSARIYEATRLDDC